MLACSVALAAAMPTAGPARADGDPASDVLATQSLFLPQDAGVPGSRQSQLVALLDGARSGGLPLRVAVIASPTDLGSVSELWRRPARYARFLGQELSLVYKGPLLVVMPDGLALHDPEARAQGAQAAVAGLAPPGSVARLGDTTLTAIRRIATASGHPLAVQSAGGEGRGDRSAGYALPWIAFAAGALLILAAWTLSLRARPLRALSRREPGPGQENPRV
jgi:hypothetical protein